MPGLGAMPREAEHLGEFDRLGACTCERGRPLFLEPGKPASRISITRSLPGESATPGLGISAGRKGRHPQGPILSKILEPGGLAKHSETGKPLAGTDFSALLAVRTFELGPSFLYL